MSVVPPHTWPHVSGQYMVCWSKRRVGGKFGYNSVNMHARATRLLFLNRQLNFASDELIWVEHFRIFRKKMFLKRKEEKKVFPKF